MISHFHISSQHQVSSFYMSAKTQRWFPSSQKLQLLHLELQLVGARAPPLVPASRHHVAAGRSAFATCLKEGNGFNGNSEKLYGQSCFVQVSTPLRHKTWPINLYEFGRLWHFDGHSHPQGQRRVSRDHCTEYSSLSTTKKGKTRCNKFSTVTSSEPFTSTEAWKAWPLKSNQIGLGTCTNI